LACGEAGIAGNGWFVEPFILVVCLVGVEDSCLGPAFDGTLVHVQPYGELGFGEQALGAEPLGVAGQLVAAARFEHDASGERLALAEAVTGGVERLGGLGVGVGVKELIERCEGVGVGLAERQAFGGIATTRLVVCPPRKRTCRWMRSVLCSAMSSTRRRTMRLRSRCAVFGLDQRVRKSVVRERIRSFSSSVRVAVAAALALS